MTGREKAIIRGKYREYVKTIESIKRDIDNKNYGNETAHEELMHELTQMRAKEDAIDALTFALGVDLENENMEEKIELLPCPFCGNKNVRLTNEAEVEGIEVCDDNYECATENYMVICGVSSCGCGATSGYAQEKGIAIKLWNRRTQNER
jgi:hypothetical protein